MSAGNAGFWVDHQPAEDPPLPREHMRWTWRPQRGTPVTSDPGRPPRNGLPLPRKGLYAGIGQPGETQMPLGRAVVAAEPPAAPEPAVRTPGRRGGTWRTRKADWAEAVLGTPRTLALCGGCDCPLGSPGCVFTCGPADIDVERRWP